MSLREINSTHLFYEAVIPVKLHSVTANNSVEANRNKYQNNEFIKIYDIIEGNHLVNLSSDNQDELLTRFIHLENKIDLMLGMAAKLLSQQNQTPKPVTVKIGTEFISWQVTNLSENQNVQVHPQLKINDELEISLFLLEYYPYSLTLPIIIRDISIDSDNCIVTSEILSIFEPVQELLLHMIFKQHRRNIANGLIKPQRN